MLDGTAVLHQANRAEYSVTTRKHELILESTELGIRSIDNICQSRMTLGQCESEADVNMRTGSGVNVSKVPMTTEAQWATTT